ERNRASEAGYTYSSAMKSKGGKWTFEELDQFLTHPQIYIPGTKMTFAGISNDQQRADVIAFLRTLSDQPAPLPTVAAAPRQPASDQKKPAPPAANQQKPAQPAPQKENPPKTNPGG